MAQTSGNFFDQFDPPQSGVPQGDGNFFDQFDPPPQETAFGHALPAPSSAKADFSQFKNVRKPVTTRSINIGPARPETPEDTKAMPERQWNMLAGQVESLTSKPSGIFGDTEGFARDVLRHAGIPVSATPALPTSEYMGNLEWGQPTSPEQAAGRNRGIGTFLAPTILGKTVGAYEHLTGPATRLTVNALNRSKEYLSGRPFRDPYAAATEQLARVTDPQRMSNKLDDWRGAEPPAILDVLDNRGRRLVRSAASGGGEDAQNVAQTYAERVAANLQDNATELAHGLTPDEPRPVAEVQADLKKARSTAANPLYEKSNRGGSIAPLQSQYEDAFNVASKNAIDAQRAVDEAEKAVADAQHRTTLTDNVYAQSSAREDLRAAQAAHEDAVKAQTAAEAQKSAVLERLRTAQSDTATGARGAIWSPRIQQFLDHPIIQRGIARGYELESLKGLEEGRPIDPTEYAATGVDASGAPIVSKTPNMRLLDTAKQGLDAILKSPEAKNEFGGLTKYGMRVDGVRRELIKELDRLNPDYSPARAQWEKDTAPLEALQVGGNAGTTRSVEYGPTIAKLAARNPQARAAAGVGYRENIVGNIEAPKEGATGYLNRLGSSTRQTKNLTTTYGRNTAAQFQKGISDEVQRANNARFIDPNTNSQTFSRLEDSGLIGKIPADALGLLKSALEWVRGGGLLTEAERNAIVDIATTRVDRLTIENLLTKNSLRPSARRGIIPIPGPPASSQQER